MGRTAQRGAEQHFPSDHGGHETLRKVAQAVVVVAVEMPGILDPLEDRHQGIGVVAADHEDGGVHGDQPVHQIGEAQARVEVDQDRHGDDRGEHFEEPGEDVVAADERPDEDQSYACQKNPRGSLIGLHFGATTQAPC